MRTSVRDAGRAAWQRTWPFLPGAAIVGAVALTTLIVWDKTPLKKTLFPGALAAVAGQLADPLGALAIEGHNRVAETGAVHGDEVVRFLRGEDDLGGFGGRRAAEGAEIRHGATNEGLSPGGVEGLSAGSKIRKGVRPKSDALAD